MTSMIKTAIATAGALTAAALVWTGKDILIQARVKLLIARSRGAFDDRKRARP